MKLTDSYIGDVVYYCSRRNSYFDINLNTEMEKMQMRINLSTQGKNTSIINLVLIIK